MKKYKCPQCHSTNAVIRYGKRKKVLRFFCKACDLHFSHNPCYIDTKRILSDHLDGFSFRTLARKYDISPMKAWRICESELQKLPDNNQFTFNYCNRFSQILVCDGKYFNIASERYDWFNGFILKRRYTKYTDCKGKFKHLNGKTGAEMTKKLEIVLQTFF